MKWLMERCPSSYREHEESILMEHGHLAVVEYLTSLKAPPMSTPKLMDQAARCGHLSTEMAAQSLGVLLLDQSHG